MAPTVTLYILGACVAASIGLLVVMLVVSAMRSPRMPLARLSTAPGMRLDAPITRPSYPSYPEWRPVKIVRFFATVLVLCLIVAVAAISYPALLDPLCEYEWFGSDAATRLREHARDIHATIAAKLA